MGWWSSTLLKIKVFIRDFLRVSIVSLRENLFVVFIKTFSQKNLPQGFITYLSYQWFCEKFLVKTTKRFYLADTIKNPQKTSVKTFIVNSVGDQ